MIVCLNSENKLEGFRQSTSEMEVKADLLACFQPDL